MESDLIIAIGGHLLEVAIPRLTGIETKLVARFASQQVPGAFDVFGGERFAVVPRDPLAQLEGQLSALLAPRPDGG